VRRSLALLAAITALAITTSATAATGRSSDTTLSVVAYSIPTAVFPKLTAAYSATSAGNGIKFTTSFAASEVQSKAVAAGLPADVLNLSISTDVDRLVSAGLVDKSWDSGRTRASSRSPLSSSCSATETRSTSRTGRIW
jgi:sulfate transport system substrate-binding protein